MQLQFRTLLALAFLACFSATLAEENTAIVPVQKLENDFYDWHKRHEEVKKLIAKRPVDLIFIGDSITHMFGGEPKSSIARGTAIWDQYYGHRNAVNMGFGWDRTQNMLWRLNNGELDGISPKVAVVMAGTNNHTGTENARTNTPEEIAEGIKAICDTIRRKSPNTKIILLSILPRGQLELNPSIQKTNKLIAKLGRKKNITFIDMWAKFANADGTPNRTLFHDTAHPNSQGYAVWAKTIEPTLNKLIGKPDAITADSRFAAMMKAEGYIAVNLTLEENHFFMDGTIDGKKGAFILDSGAMASLLQESLVEKYNMEISKVENAEAVGVGGTIKIKASAKTRNLACGGIGGMTQSFYVMNMSHWPEDYAKRFDGILGTDFLKAQNGIFDYARGVLWLKSDAENLTSAPRFDTSMKSQGYTSLKFVEEQNHLFINATISGKEARFVLDSGAVVSLFKESAVGRYNFQIISGRAVINGVGGPIEIKALAKTRQFGVGDLNVVAQDFYVMNMSTWPQDRADRIDGVLGNDFLNSKKAMIDYEHKLLWLELE